MKNVNFKIKGKLDIEFEENYCKSSIQDVTDNYIAISVPMKDGVYVAPQNGDKLDVIYYEGLDVYKFETFVLGRIVEGVVPLILFAHPQNIKKVQRREFVRVPIVSYVQYAIFDSVEKAYEINEKIKNLKSFKGLLLDLSGGGLRLKVYEPIKQGDKLIIEIPEENDKIRITGQVVRTEKGEDGQLVCGINFIDIDNRTREKIIQLIFNIMRKQRKTL